MAEALQPESGFEPDVGPEPITPAAAMAIGVRKGRGREKDDPEFDAFLRKQSRLIDLQTEHLHEQRQVILLRLRLGAWKDRVTLALQGLTAAVGLAVGLGVAAMAWQARQDHGLSIAAFSAPPDLAARGLTGQVVASRVVDRLADLQAQTATARPAATYAENWGDDIKVEIPETGVSIGELNRFLREQLGRQTRITGEVVRTPTGLSVTARAEGAPAKTFAGSEADIDTLIGQAAEGVYALSQPYRYAAYLQSQGRTAEALPRFAMLARDGSAEDRPWAYAGWSEALIQHRQLRQAAAVVREGQRLGLPLYESGALNNLGVTQFGLSQRQAELENVRVMQKEAQRTGRGFGGLDRDAAMRNMQALVDGILGDYRDQLAIWTRGRNVGVEGSANGVQLGPLIALGMVQSHDVSAGLAFPVPVPAQSNWRTQADLMLENWPALVADGEKRLAPAGAGIDSAPLAIGYAKVGRFGEAKALVAPMPGDCEVCLYARAMVAETAGDRVGADRWFAALGRLTPDLPLTDAEWAAMLLARGDLKGGAAHAEAGHRKGPHFADPLELWGEALLRGADARGSVAKFAEADKYAPRWGRNHMIWGEALMLLGRYREARAQYEAANGLDLSKPDRAALNVLLDRTAKGPLHG